MAIATLTGVLDDAPWWLALLGAVFAGVGFLVMFSAKKRTVKLVKDGRSSVHEKRLIGGQTTAADFALSDVASVNLHTRINHSNSSSDSGPKRVSQLLLTMNNNDQILIGKKTGNAGGLRINGMNAGSLIQKAPLSKEGEQIAEFIGVPFHANTPGSVVEAVKNIAGAVNGQAGNTTVPQQPSSVTPDERTKE